MDTMFSKLRIMMLCLHSTWCQSTYNDPSWLSQRNEMWYWEKGSAMKLHEAWQLGVTGKGVNIVVIDDGVDFNVDEIKPNYNSELSYDYKDDTRDAGPRFPNVHGTRVASVAAGRRNNGVCGFGAAPEAGIISARILSSGLRNDGISPENAIKALTDMNRHIHTGVFITSWGTQDTGFSYEFPTQEMLDAQKTASENGRDGKGSIIVISSGNGGTNSDDCAADGFVQATSVVPVQAVNKDGTAPSWTEPCAAAFTSAYVDTGLVAVNPPLASIACTTEFGGTSAAAPVVGGILALAMESNPTLSRADLLHLVVQASNSSATSDRGWKTNAAGVRFHPRFGFGLLNAQRLVQLAGSTKQRLSSKSSVCELTGSIAGREATFDATPCNIAKVEHATLVISATADKRGDLEIILLSPSNTPVQLLGQRNLDIYRGMHDWHLTTPFFWNENVAGSWKIEVKGSINVIVTKALLNVYSTEEGGGEGDGGKGDGGSGLEGWQIGLIVVAVLAVVGGGVGGGVYIARKQK